MLSPAKYQPTKTMYVHMYISRLPRRLMCALIIIVRNDIQVLIIAIIVITIQLLIIHVRLIRVHLIQYVLEEKC